MDYKAKSERLKGLTRRLRLQRAKSGVNELPPAWVLDWMYDVVDGGEQS